MWPALHHGRNERFDKIVILLTAHALVSPADIEWIDEKFAVVGADIEQDWQGGGRVKPGASRVQGELANGDAHAAGALIA